jgi:GT2 family glycosyltransferase
MNSSRQYLQSGPVLSILIVNYNGLKFVDQCLSSIRDKVSTSFEVIVVDNASHDGSAEYIEQAYPWIRLIRSQENLGFVRGNNLAARYATGKYYLLLNCDTILMSDVTAAVDVLDKLSNVGIVGAKMFSGEGNALRNTGHFPRPMRLWVISSLYCNAERRPYGPGELEIFQVDWVEGSFLLTRSDLWWRTGGLDEAIFMYGEDVEFCRRCKAISYDCVTCSLVSYKHFCGFSVDRIPHLYKAFRYYHQKFSTPNVRYRAHVVMRVGLFVRVYAYMACFLFTGNTKAEAKSAVFSKVLREWHEVA